MTTPVAVQRAVLRSDLPAQARQILLTLAVVSDFDTAVIPEAHTPSLTELAKQTDLARSTVAKFLNLLEECGWVKRTRPDVAKARAEGARTGYRLKIGGSPSRGLVRDTDQEGGPSSGLAVVRDTDRPSPPHGRIPDKPSRTNQKDQSSPRKPERPDVEQVCRHLADRIEANGSKRPPITKGWRDAARLLIDKDGRTVEQILRAIDWCQDDPFWRANVLSMPKLREKYDQLRLAAQRPANGRASPKRSTTDDRVSAALALAERFDRGEIGS